jgi:hypothetical protein
MKRSGRPVLGAISGFFFGLSLALVSLTTGVLALDSPILIVLPILFLVVGILWAKAAILGGRPAEPQLQ